MPNPTKKAAAARVRQAEAAAQAAEAGLWSRLGIGQEMRRLLKAKGRRPDDSAERVLFALAANRALAPPGNGGTFAFYRPDGTRLPSCPPLPEPDGAIGQVHDADITPDTIIPPWYGERLDLDHAIYICFANARTREEREQDRDGDPADRGRVTVYEPEDCEELIRQYLEQAPRGTGPVRVPIQV